MESLWCSLSSFNSCINKIDLVWFYLIKMSQYFPKPFEPFSGDINFKVDLSFMQQKQILKMFHMFILQVLH